MQTRSHKVKNKFTSYKSIGDVTTVILTKEVIDRDNEVVVIDGLDLSNYNKNPVLLWAHNKTELPLGTISNIRVEVDNGIKCLVGDINWSPSYDKAQTVKKLFQENILKGVSMGFNFSDWIVLNDATATANYPSGTILITKSELLEVSAVPVPANQDSLTLAKSKGIDISIVQELPEEVPEVVMEDKVDKEETADLSPIYTKLDILEAKITQLTDRLDSLILERMLFNGESGEQPKDDPEIEEVSDLYNNLFN